MRRILFSVILLLLLSCSAATYGEPFQLKEGETTWVQNIKVTFVDIVEDSRCPADAVCVWQGVAVIELEVFHDGKMNDIKLATEDYQDHKTSALIDTYSVRLVDLQPQPVSMKKIDDYIVTLVVS